MNLGKCFGNNLQYRKIRLTLLQLKYFVPCLNEKKSIIIIFFILLYFITLGSLDPEG